MSSHSGITGERPSNGVSVADPAEPVSLMRAHRADIPMRSIVVPDEAWCSFGVRDPSFLVDVTGRPIKFDGRYRMFFSGRDREMTDGGLTRIGWASSEDMIDWRVEPKPVFADGQYCNSGGVLEVEPGLYRIYYAFDTLLGFRHAETRDFLRWQVSENPILEPAQFACHRMGLPHVCCRGGVWHLLFEGFRRAFAIYHATSTDGRVWTSCGSQPVYEASAAGWDRLAQANPGLSHAPDHPGLLLYNGYGRPGDWDLGVLWSREPFSAPWVGLAQPLLCRGDVDCLGGRLEGARLVRAGSRHLLYFFVLPSKNSFAGGTIKCVDVPEDVLKHVTSIFDAERNVGANHNDPSAS